MKKIVFFILSLLFFTSAYSEVKEYKEPRVDGLRMDHCLHWGKQCGDVAAYQWCHSKKYRKAIYWEEDRKIGDKSPTKTFESKEICSNDTCSGFKTIVCYR